jgi:hypothetical protein
MEPLEGERAESEMSETRAALFRAQLSHENYLGSKPSRRPALRAFWVGHDSGNSQKTYSKAA